MRPPLVAFLLFVNCTVGELFKLGLSLRTSVLCDRGVKVVILGTYECFVQVCFDFVYIFSDFLKHLFPGFSQCLLGIHPYSLPFSFLLER